MSAFRSMPPSSSGSVNFPLTWPSWVSHIENDVALAAAFSSRSSSFASWASAASGSTIASTRRPWTFSSLAS